MDSMQQAETTQRAATRFILAVSAAAICFLLWLIYYHDAPPELARQYEFLPALNALLNGLSAVALGCGFYFIKQRNQRAHRASMLVAFCFSSLFLVSYIVTHAIRGDTVFPGQGLVRTVYLSILASHIILSIVALPLVLLTFFLSLTGRFPQHKKIARYTFPIWIYVSITGVVVFVFLRAYAY